MNFSGAISSITPFIDGDVVNKDSNYDEKFWDEVKKEVWGDGAFVQMRTKKTGFEVATGMRVVILQNDKPVDLNAQSIERDKYVALKTTINAEQVKNSVVIYKYAANLSSQNYKAEELEDNLKATLLHISEKGFETMLAEQAAAWAKKWERNYIIIECDAAAQQGIRFNIFQLNQNLLR